MLDTLLATLLSAHDCPLFFIHYLLHVSSLVLTVELELDLDLLTWQDISLQKIKH